jgi:uncharacterized Zn finger protein
MSKHTEQKATRLLAEGRVSPDDIREIAFTVRGDNNTYGVKLACDCPAAGSCSHLQAVLAWVTASPEDKAVMQQILDLRGHEILPRERAAGEAAFDRL